MAIGVVVVAGVAIATLTTLIVVPSVYALVGRFTGSPKRRTQELERQLSEILPGDAAARAHSA